jgi:hypothetical protein
MTGMGKPSADQQTWVYRTASDSWQAGATGGGGGSTVVTSGLWTTAVDIDFTAQSSQTFTTDGTYTIAGFTWTKNNSANEATHASIGPSGLNFQPASSTDLNTNTYTAPTLAVALASLIPNFAIDMPIRVWLYTSANNSTTNYDGNDLVLGNATPAIASGSSFVRASRGVPNPGTTLGNYYALNLNGARPSFESSADFANTNVQVIVMSDGMAGGNSQLLVGNYNAGWPAESALAPVANATQAGGVTDITAFSITTAQNLILGAHRAGSSTALNITFSRLKVEYLSPIVLAFSTPAGQNLSTTAYYGFSTGNLLWNASGSWTNAMGVPSNFNDVIQNNVIRSGSIFTFGQTGVYNFRASFNAMAGGNGTYLAYRLSGSAGTAIERTTFASDNPQLATLEGLINVTAGSQYTLQYLISGAAGQVWQTSDPIGVGVDTENMRTGEISIFSLASAASIVSNNFAAYEGYCTGSLQWNATSWTDFSNVPGNFFDIIQNGITRSSSVFTVTQAGLYHFHSSFVLQGTSEYYGFRLSGSNGTIIQQVGWEGASDNGVPQPRLHGNFQLNAGDSFKLQYIVKSGTPANWAVSDPLGGESMRTGNISIFLIPSGSTTNNFTSSITINNTTNNITNIVTGTVSNGTPLANYAVVTSSNSFQFDNTVVGFVGVTGVSASITTSGSPVLIMVNASWVAQTAGAQAFFSLTRDGVNLGSQYSGMQGAGPTAQSYNNNASFAYVDFGATPGVSHSYAFVVSGTIGTGLLGAYGVGPSSIMLFEMINANVVTASTTLTQAVPGGNLSGLTANIIPRRGPVLCIGSSNMSSDTNGSWCWFDIFRNGSSLANGAGQGLSVNVGSATNEIQGNCIMVLDQSPTVGATNTYAMRATNGGGTNHVNTNSILSSLILWELTDINYKYSFSTSQITPATNPSYSDVDPQNPTQGLITRGRPVLLISNINSNTAGGGGRNGYTFFRNGSNVIPQAKGMQLADGEGNNDWNKMPTLFWIDQPPGAGFYQYQVMGTVVSSSAFTAQGSYTYLFMYELDAGYQQGTYFGGWLDTGNKLTTTASVSIGGTLSVAGPLVTNGQIFNSSVKNTNNYQILATDQQLFADLTLSALTWSLPPNPTQGEWHRIKDVYGYAHINGLMLTSSAKFIEQFTSGTALSLTMNQAGDAVDLVFNGTFWSIT